MQCCIGNGIVDYVANRVKILLCDSADLDESTSPVVGPCIRIWGSDPAFCVNPQFCVSILKRRVVREYHPCTMNSEHPQIKPSEARRHFKAVEPFLVTRKEAAHLLSISIRSVDYMIASGKLLHRRIGTRVLVPASQVRRMAETGCPYGVISDREE